MGKPILCLDFDGVIHSYTSGWKGARCIPDPPVPGAIEFMGDALVAGWDVVIHSSRARHFGGITAMRLYLKEHAGNLYYDSPAGNGLENVRFARLKPSALVTIDDRALTFTGIWPTLDNLSGFKPWNKKPPRPVDRHGVLYLAKYCIDHGMTPRQLIGSYVRDMLVDEVLATRTRDFLARLGR